MGLTGVAGVNNQPRLVFISGSLIGPVRMFNAMLDHKDQRVLTVFLFTEIPRTIGLVDGALELVGVIVPTTVQFVRVRRARTRLDRLSP